MSHYSFTRESVTYTRELQTRTLLCYRDYYFYTICHFWKNGFDTAANLRKANMVPIDKFKPENIERALEYIHAVLSLDQSRLKFVDEKSLKGAEIFNRKVRRDPITGEVPSIITDSDFRNTYTIIGLCGVDTGEVPSIITYSDF